MGKMAWGEYIIFGRKRAKSNSILKADKQNSTIFEMMSAVLHKVTSFTVLNISSRFKSAQHFDDWRRVYSSVEFPVV